MKTAQQWRCGLLAAVVAGVGMSSGCSSDAYRGSDPASTLPHVLVDVVGYCEG